MEENQSEDCAAQMMSTKMETILTTKMKWRRRVLNQKNVLLLGEDIDLHRFGLTGSLY